MGAYFSDIDIWDRRLFYPCDVIWWCDANVSESERKVVLHISSNGARAIDRRKTAREYILKQFSSIKLFTGIWNTGSLKKQSNSSKTLSRFAIFNYQYYAITQFTTSSSSKQPVSGHGQHTASGHPSYTQRSCFMGAGDRGPSGLVVDWWSGWTKDPIAMEIALYYVTLHWRY